MIRYLINLNRKWKFLIGSLLVLMIIAIIILIIIALKSDKPNNQVNNIKCKPESKDVPNARIQSVPLNGKIISFRGFIEYSYDNQEPTVYREPTLISASKLNNDYIINFDCLNIIIKFDLIERLFNIEGKFSKYPYENDVWSCKTNQYNMIYYDLNIPQNDYRCFPYKEHTLGEVKFHIGHLDMN